MSMLTDFKQFILRGNTVDLAVGVVIGAAFNSVIQSMVKDLITPLVGIFYKNNFSSAFVVYRHNTFLYGDFINTSISFVIIAAVVFFLVVKPINKLTELSQRGKVKIPTTKKCPFCYSDVPRQANKCMYCTSKLPSETK